MPDPREQRDELRRLLNRLDAAITHHRRTAETVDVAEVHDEALWAAHERVMRDASDLTSDPERNALIAALAWCIGWIEGQDATAAQYPARVYESVTGEALGSRHADQLIAQRDEAIRTRENANAVSVRIEKENVKLTARNTALLDALKLLDERLRALNP